MSLLECITLNLSDIYMYHDNWSSSYITIWNPKIQFWQITNNEIGISLLQCVLGLHLQIWDYNVNESDEIW